MFTKHLFLGLCLCGTALFAQDTIQQKKQNQRESLETIQIDSKTEQPRKNSGKVISVITAEDLERSAGQTVQQLINRLSGIEINGSRSNDGQNLGYYVRGGRNRQVVIMVDGVQLNDPSSIANDYDLRLIPTESIERIEVLKGASSVLYGTGASTAVISITTKKASKKAIALNYTTTVGTNQSSENQGYDLNEFTNNASVNGTLKKFFYNASFNNRYVDGLSAVESNNDDNSFDEDVFNRYNARLKLGYNFSEDVSFSQFVSIDEFKADYDNFDFTDAENRSITKQVKTGGRFVWKYKHGVYVFNDNMSWIEREFESDFPTRSESEAYTLDNYLTYNVSEKLSGLVGLNFNTSKYSEFEIPFGEDALVESLSDDDAQFDIIDPYVNAVYTSDFGLNLNAGIRVNIHSEYDTNLVYNVNPSYNIELGANNLKFLASYSTAYITPSLYQIFSPQYGNADLEPEDNRTIEGGAELTTPNKWRFSAVYFNRTSENFIDFVTVDPENFISEYQNIDDEFATQGLEVEVEGQVTEKLKLNANYTYTNPENRFSQRIPEHKANLNLDYSFTKKTVASLNYQYNSEREDQFSNPETFASETTTLDSFSLVDFYISHQLLKNLKLFAGVNNILNDDYQEIFGFQTRGRNARFGLSFNF